MSVAYYFGSVGFWQKDLSRLFTENDLAYVVTDFDEVDREIGVETTGLDFSALVRFVVDTADEERIVGSLVESLFEKTYPADAAFYGEHAEITRKGSAVTTRPDSDWQELGDRIPRSSR
jgi:hypothetical protein